MHFVQSTLWGQHSLSGTQKLIDGIFQESRATFMLLLLLLLFYAGGEEILSGL